MARGNLETRPQEAQMRVGLAALGVSLVAAMLLANSAVSPIYRTAAFLPFFIAAYGVLSSFYRTCGVMAIAGQRMTNDGTERVADRDELAQLRSRGARVLLGSAGLAAIATSLLFVAS